MHRRHGGPIQNRFTLPAASEGYHANDSLVKLSWETNYNRHMHDVVVYSRKGCHLCDVVKETLTHLRGDADFQWREVDVALHLNRGISEPGWCYCSKIADNDGLTALKSRTNRDAPKPIVRQSLLYKLPPVNWIRDANDGRSGLKSGYFCPTHRKGKNSFSGAGECRKATFCTPDPSVPMDRWTV
jgi:hypothetical protein